MLLIIVWLSKVITILSMHPQHAMEFPLRWCEKSFSILFYPFTTELLWDPPFYMVPLIVMYTMLQSHKILWNQHVSTWGKSSLSNYSGRHSKKLIVRILDHLILILFCKWSCAVDFIINNVRNVSSFQFIIYSTDKRKNKICVYNKRRYVMSSYPSPPKKLLIFYILTYFNTVCTVHCMKINLHNQLNMHKICSFNISKSPTYFST